MRSQHHSGGGKRGAAATWRGEPRAQASNILSVDTKPWSPEGHVYEPEVAEDPLTGAMRVQLNQRIRFRVVDGPDGRPVRESNARFVRWSDGSLQVAAAPNPDVVFNCFTETCKNLEKAPESLDLRLLLTEVY